MEDHDRWRFRVGVIPFDKGLEGLRIYFFDLLQHSNLALQTAKMHDTRRKKLTHEVAYVLWCIADTNSHNTMQVSQNHIDGNDQEARKLSASYRLCLDLWISRIKRLAKGDKFLSENTHSLIRSLQNTIGLDKNLPKRWVTLRGKPAAAVIIIKKAAAELGVPGFEEFDESLFLVAPDNLNAAESAGLHESGGSLPQTPDNPLIAYLDLIRKRICVAEDGGHRSREREEHHAFAQALKGVRAWAFAAEAYGHVATLFSREGDVVGAARNYLEQGMAYYRAAIFDQAETALKIGTALLHNLKPSHSELTTELRLSDYLGLTLCRLGKNEKALNLLRKSLQIADDLNFHVPLADASRHARIGVVLLEMGEYTDAITELHIAIRLRREKEAWCEVARALKYVGLNYFNMGQYKEALVLWDLCLSQQRAVDDAAEVAWLKFYRAGVFRVWATKVGDTIGDNIDREEVLGAFVGEEKLAADTLSKKFSSFPGKPLRSQALVTAKIFYEQALNTATRIGLTNLANRARLMLLQLPVS